MHFYSNFNICHTRYIEQIKQSLQIAGVSSRESSLIVRGDDSDKGMQIDLLIDRADDVVNVCEMKFCQSEFVVTKAYATQIVSRIEALEKLLPSKTFLRLSVPNPFILTSMPTPSPCSSPSMTCSGHSIPSRAYILI